MNIRNTITQISRVLVGLLFIFSGFIKADDPLGFAYKNNEYFEILHLNFLVPYSVGLSIFMCVLEIFLGFCILLGVYRNFTAWLLLLMIIFFGFLTGFTAIGNWLKDNPEAGFAQWASHLFHFKTENITYMKDCGCFGDAVKLDPWQSFEKNVVLFILILILFFNRHLIKPLFSLRLSRNIALLSLLVTLLFTLYAYIFLPPLDFRPYAVGKDLKKQMEIPPGALKDSFVMSFVYQKNGKEYRFGMDELGKIDSTYTYVRREDKKIREGFRPPIQDFSIYDMDGKDRTPEFLNEAGYRLLIIQYDLDHTHTGAQPRLNKLVEELQKEGKVKVWALTASSSQLAEEYRKFQKLPYDFRQTDATVLKTVIRSNPGLMLLRDNLVIAQWPSTWLPSKETIDRYAK